MGNERLIWHSHVRVIISTHRIVIGIAHEISGLDQVQANPPVVPLVDAIELQNLLQPLDLDEKVHRLGLGVVSDVERDDDVDHSQEVGEGLVVLGVGPRDDAGVVLPTDLAGEGADELVPPRSQVVGGLGVPEGGG